jgi:hypothetical protein
MCAKHRRPKAVSAPRPRPHVLFWLRKNSKQFHPSDSFSFHRVPSYPSYVWY